MIAACFSKVHWSLFGILVLSGFHTTAAEEQASESTELSVAPLDHYEYPPTRPVWVSNSLTKTQVDGCVVVVSVPSLSKKDATESLRVMKRIAVESLVKDWSSKEGRVTYLLADLSDQEINEKFLRQSYEGELKQGDNRFYEQAAELCLTEDAIGYLERKSWNSIIAKRLWYLSAGLGCVFVSLVIGTVTLSRLLVAPKVK